MMGAPALGFLLRSLRDERGLSLRELAQLAGIDHAYVHRLETGDKEAPSEEVLTKLIRALKAEKREAAMLRFLAQHRDTDADLISLVLKDPTVSYEIFASVAGVAYRGAARPDYPKLIRRIRMVLDAEGGSG
jgi:transcriptional regulator with XRE-family HTH domain